MAFNIASVSIKLLTDTKQFSRGLATAGQRLQTLQRTASRVGKAIGVGLGAALGGAVTQTFRINQQLLNLSRQLNRPVEDLQALAFAARQAGVSQANFETTIRRINRRASDAARGNAQLAETFTLLNIDAKRFLDLSLPDQVAVLAKNFRELEGDSRKQSIAFQLMDTEGQQFLQLLKEGPSAVQAYVQQAKELDIANRQAAEGFDLLRRFAGRAIGFIGGRIARTAGIIREFFAGPLSPQAQTTRAAAVQQEADAQAVLNAAKKVELTVDERRARLKKATTGKRDQIGFGRQINRALDFVNIGGGQRQQRVIAPQLERTNALLSDIRGAIRNNTTGNTVVFTG